jgi:ferredoxin
MNVRYTFTLLTLAVVATLSEGFQPMRPTNVANAAATSSLFATTVPRKKKGYEPTWKKRQTLAEAGGSKDFKDIGLKGTIEVIFKQGNETKSTMAIVGQPLRDVATQAGQFVKYGCGKGECGTCEALIDGKWIRPCSTNVPALQPGQQLVVQVKEGKAAKTTSSGKFYSLRSFIMGFWTNLLGMIGFVKTRRAAKRNWEERQEYEALIRQKTLEKKRLKEQGGGGPAMA